MSTTPERCICGSATPDFYCTDADGKTRPMCVDDCGEHASNSDGRCRDCNIQHLLNKMECPTCKRMRYRTDVFGGLGEWLWGDRCTCNDKPGTQ